MSGPLFSSSGAAHLLDYRGRKVRLFRKTWQLKLSHPERGFLTWHYEDLQLTLREPVQVVESRSDPDVHLYYREIRRLQLRQGMFVPAPPWVRFLCVLVNIRRDLVVTFYPTDNPKKGRNVWPT